jgi:ribosomal protein S18 acetylase RimI-like enzyme
MSIDLREFTPADYDAAIALWAETEGIVLRDVDARAPLLEYLARNRGMSVVALDSGAVVGAVLCGTDGRRGYLQHLAVAGSHRRRGIGRALVERCLSLLSERGIHKCHLMVLPTNTPARAFWQCLGWQERPDVLVMSHLESGHATA